MICATPTLLIACSLSFNTSASLYRSTALLDVARCWLYLNRKATISDIRNNTLCELSNNLLTDKAISFATITALLRCNTLPRSADQ